MSLTLDPSINSLVSQSMALSQAQVQSVAQVKLAKTVDDTLKQQVLTLISSAGLQTYNAQGVMQTTPAVGARVNVVA